MRLSLTVRPPYFEKITRGEKTVEGRLKKPDFLKIKVHGSIRFQDSTIVTRFIDTRVVFLHTYPSFREMLLKEGLNKCLPGVRTLEEGINLYHSFPSYLEGEKIYGVLAIGIEIVKKRGD